MRKTFINLFINIRGKAILPVAFPLMCILVNVSALMAQDDAMYFPPKANLNENEQARPMHSPHKATIYSLALPGLGQAYNKKYWKIPVIYAGFGYLGYSIKINHDEMRKFTEAYRYVSGGETYPTDNEYVTRYPNPADLLRGRDFYRRRVELHIIYSAAWYLLNVIDAAVDAHFFNYDISDDLSLKIEPAYITPFTPGMSGASGLKLSMNF